MRCFISFSLSLYPFSLYDQLKEPVWFQNFSVNALRRSFASSKNTIRKKPCCNSNSTPCIELKSPTEFADEKQKTTQNNTVNVLVVNAIYCIDCQLLLVQRSISFPVLTPLCKERHITVILIIVGAIRRAPSPPESGHYGWAAFYSVVQPFVRCQTP